MSTDKESVMAPYRDRIDALDRDIIALLAKRYGVIRDVVSVKARAGLPAVIPARVAEVRRNAEHLAAEHGLDIDFVSTLYQQIIDHSCALEDTLMRDNENKDAA